MNYDIYDTIIYEKKKENFIALNKKNYKVNASCYVQQYDNIFKKSSRKILLGTDIFLVVRSKQRKKKKHFRQFPSNFSPTKTFENILFQFFQ